MSISMEREIKFREFVNGKFHYWGFVEEGIFKGPVTPSLTRGKHSQYTGLKDKNGKEIYEGDIVETPSVKKMVIDWSEKFASFVIDRNGWAFQHFFGEAMNPQDCTVIGNIYESPELLNNG